MRRRELTYETTTSLGPGADHRVCRREIEAVFDLEYRAACVQAWQANVADNQPHDCIERRCERRGE